MGTETIEERIAFLRDAQALFCANDGSQAHSSPEDGWHLCLLALALDEFAEESDLRLLTGRMDPETRESLLALWKMHELKSEG